MAKAHWSESTFVVTYEGPRVGSRSIGTMRQGYCRECFGDMADYGRGLQHYNSHKRAAALGLWGKRGNAANLRPKAFRNATERPSISFNPGERPDALRLQAADGSLSLAEDSGTEDGWRDQGYLR